MNIFRVDFHELYERHLCRHSQFGINVIHLAAVVGIYLLLYDLVYQLVGSEWLLLLIAVPHLAVIAFNVPARVLAVCLVFMALFFALFVWLPKLPWWVDLPGIWLCYKVQALSHKIYTVERDMTEFNQKYKKGFVLFVLLSVYELPILLNYLCFDGDNVTVPPAPRPEEPASPRPVPVPEHSEML